MVIYGWENCSSIVFRFGQIFLLCVLNMLYDSSLRKEIFYG